MAMLCRPHAVARAKVALQSSRAASSKLYQEWVRRATRAMRSDSTPREILWPKHGAALLHTPMLEIDRSCTDPPLSTTSLAIAPPPPSQPPPLHRYHASLVRQDVLELGCIRCGDASTHDTQKESGCDNEPRREHKRPKRGIVSRPRSTCCASPLNLSSSPWYYPTLCRAM
jgi:hypothetical protein